MTTLLENGGTVELWGGWSVWLPPAYHGTNADGSWSAWGADWTVDAIILEVSGQETGEAVCAEDMLGEQQSVNASGSGWVGSVAFLEEESSDRPVYRLAATLAASNTSLSFWVSYFDPRRRPFAEELLSHVGHTA